MTRQYVQIKESFVSVITVSSRFGSEIQALERRIDRGDYELANTHRAALDRFELASDMASGPTILALSSTLVRLGIPGIGETFELSLAGSGIGPVGTLEQLFDAIDGGLASGVIDSVTLDRKAGGATTTLMQLTTSATGYTLTSGADVLSVTGRLPGSFEQLFELAGDLLGQFDIDWLRALTPAERIAYFDALSAYGITGLSLSTNGRQSLALSIEPDQIVLSLGGLRIEVEGRFPTDFGAVANALFELDLFSSPEGVLDLSQLGGLAIDSLAIIARDGTELARAVGPLTDEASAELSEMVLDGDLRVAPDRIIVAEADAGIRHESFWYGDLVFGSDSRLTGDSLFGGFADDFFFGYSGDDILSGGYGNDLLDGGAGNDTITGGFGNDTIDGGSGTADWLFAGPARNLRVDLAVTGPQMTGEGHDIIRNIENVAGGFGSDRIGGSSRSNELIGNFGNDTLSGAGGNDTLRGGDGADLLIGGRGNDFLFGGLGRDVFQFNSGSGSDRIRDFENGIDRIQVLGVAFDSLTFAQDGNSTLITYGANVIRVDGILPGLLDAGDFILG